jgi:PAS domain S-box-containing protein
MKVQIEKKILIGFTISLVALAGMGWLSYRTTTNLVATENWVSHTHEVIAALESGRALLTDVENKQRAFLLTGDKLFLNDCRDAQSQIDGWIELLRILTDGSPTQQEHLKSLESLIPRRLALLNNRIELRRQKGLLATADAVALREGKDLMDAIWEDVAAMRDEENQLLAKREQAAQAEAKTSMAIMLTGSILTGAICVLSCLMIRRDLNLRKQAETDLQENQALLESILDNTPALIFLKDLSGRYQFVNRRFAQWIGLAGAEIKGKTAFDIVPKERAQIAQEHQALVMAKEAPVEFAETITYPDGPRAHVAVKFPLRDLTGKIYAMGGISTDVTERQRAEQLLKVSEERLRSLVEAVKDYAIFMLDADGMVVSWNAGAEQIKGYSAAEIIGRNFECFYSEAAIRDGLPDRLLNTAATEGRFEDEGWRVRKDGTQFWANVIVTAIRNPNGQLAGFAKVTRDLTERRRVEQMHLQFRALFESLPGLYVVLTPDFIIVAASDAYLKATMTQRENLLGKGFFEVFPDNPGDPGATAVANVRASLNQVLQTAVTDTMAIQRYDVRGPDGVFEERFWSPVNSPVLGVDRRIEYIVHRVEDVTEFVRRKPSPHLADQQELQVRMQRMEAEIFQSSQQVQAINQQLRVSNQELESFSYSVSHDLRAPLRHIDGFVGLLTKQAGEKLDERERRYLKVITDSARQMGTLIDDLLLFSRMGRAQLRQSKVASRSLVHEAVDSLQAELEDRQIAWKIGELPEVQADLSMLRQVWVNLLANAVKYTRARNPAAIEVGCTDPVNGENVFFVRDNGVGFDMRYADKLFGVFQRLHHAEQFEGTGIGLANVRRIIHRHGGRTWAEGQVDGGATFFFSLPIASTSNTNISHVSA